MKCIVCNVLTPGKHVFGNGLHLRKEKTKMSTVFFFTVNIVVVVVTL